MKTWGKRLLMGLFWAQLLLLSACGKAVKENVPMGRYIEQEIPVEGFIDCEGMMHSVQWQDGTIQLFKTDETGKLYSYKEQEGLGFKPVKLEWEDDYVQLAKEQGLHIAKAAVDSKDSLYLACLGYEKGYVASGGIMDEAHMRSYILKVEGDRITQVVEPKVEGQPYLSFQQFMVLDNGECIIADYPLGVCQFNLATGQMVAQYTSADEGPMVCLNNKLYMISSKEQELQVYSLSTHQIENRFKGDHINRSSYICQGDKGIYLVGEKGIWHLVGEGDIWEQLMSEEGTSLGLPSVDIEGVYYHQGQVVVHMYKTGEGDIYKAYAYSENTPTKPEVELNAYMLEENETFREGLVGYELAHPEVRIHIQVGVGSSQEISQADAIKALNTEVLAGMGPDLILLDGLEAATYVKQGVLANLEELSNMQQLIPQICDSLKVEEGTYMVPLRFTTYALIGEDEVISEGLKGSNAIVALADYARVQKDSNLLADSSPEALYSVMAPMILNGLKPLDEALSEETIRTLLKATKDLTPHYEKSELKKMNEENEGKVRVGREEMASLYAMLNGKAKVQIREIGWDIDLLDISNLLEFRGQNGFTLLAQDGKLCFNPKAMVGINHSTHQKVLASDILNFMLEEKMQDIFTAEGLPTRQETFNKWMKKNEGKTGMYCIRGVINGDAYSTFKVDYDYQCAFPLYMEQLKNLQLPAISQVRTEQIILEAARPYWNSEKTLDEVISEIMPKLELQSKEK